MVVSDAGLAALFWDNDNPRHVNRVIGSTDALTGIAGGLKTKQYLLDHERAVLAKVEKWRTQEDSNLWPLPSEGNALSS